jgi:REP element-mobilizing transposase RayT
MQLSLFTGRLQRELTRAEHGGVTRGEPYRKVARPVCTRRPMHVVLRSERARGAWSLRKHESRINEALRACARRSGTRVYEFANVGSHLHLLLRARRRDGFQAFLRAFAGMAARIVTGARRGRPCGGGPFWTTLAWSRIVAWGRDYRGVRHYVFRNQIEGVVGPRIRHALERGPSPMAIPREERQLGRKAGRPELEFRQRSGDASVAAQKPFLTSRRHSASHRERARRACDRDG